MNESIMDKIEGLLDDYVSAYVDYHYSQTGCSATYNRQAQEMCDARYILLDLISENLPK